MNFIPIEKWIRCLRIISANGGFIGSFLKLWRTDTLKIGKYVGSDAFGNKYFENNYYPIGRSRWLEFNPKFKWNYDATQITPEWFGWLHHKTDNLPQEDPAKTSLNCCCWAHCWLLPPEENRSGTELAFYPYSTVKQHIQPWNGVSICDRLKGS